MNINGWQVDKLLREIIFKNYRAPVSVSDLWDRLYRTLGSFELKIYKNLYQEEDI